MNRSGERFAKILIDAGLPTREEASRADATSARRPPCSCEGCPEAALSDRPLCAFCDDAPSHLHCPACGRANAEYLRVQTGSPRGVCVGCGARLFPAE